MPNYGDPFRRLAKSLEELRTILFISRVTRNLTDKAIRYRLDCGHVTEEVDDGSPAKFGRIPCRRCGVTNATIAVRNNPSILDNFRTGVTPVHNKPISTNKKLRPDGRPKPRFRTPEGEKKFLQRLQASRDANSIDRLRRP